jgi:acetylornithine deacetylase/succinyl-diaminopimelate desuccinylase-like protein
MLGHAPFDSKEFEHSVGVDAVSGEKGYTSLERIGIRPCLDVNGIWSGDTGEESTKTIIPSRAHAKISMRLVPNQKADVIAGLFEKHFKAIAPEGVSVKVSSIHSGNWFVVPISSSLYGAASKAIGEVYGTDTVPNRGGGSIPILADMHEILGADLLLMGFGLERDTIHSPNESFLLSQFFKGMESIALFYKYF